MTKKTRGSNANRRRKDPNQDVQPWLGWIAALLVVVIVVVAVAMGMARTRDQEGSVPEVRMTPLVGGIEVPLATETGAAVVASEVTAIPEADSVVITDGDGITMVTVVTTTAVMTATDTFTLTGEMTPTDTTSGNASVTATVGVSVTNDVTPSATEAATVAATITEAAASEPTATTTVATTPTPRPTATTRPTVTPLVDAPVFEVGDNVTARAGRVEVHADAAADALTLDSFGAGIPLEVLPPSGDFTAYPVEVDGHGWVRVRAADGLVGWVMTDQVEAQ